ncbi:unnamed protein product [Didymodactylos carnosus]|uniref:G-protein coupled receptors family 1 profile domain-containing protein n=1 Tax=Didymodactylos carnosus TaxID=1234261 RepID=A0A8S2DBC4_9BILA|nr:unnamed protein product [Didymodactylos carnosus]CAF3672127.1 unnamed protein product [Didymodactylos carnosus]
MNQTFSNLTFSFQIPQFDPKLKFVEQVVLTTIFISALIGNIFVLTLILRNKHRRFTRMPFFILNLTIADILVALFCVFPMLIWKSTTTFFGGDILCRVMAFIMLTVTYISVYTLVLMAIDRYKAIVYPLTTYTWTARSGLFHIIFVWCLSFLLATPQLFIFGVGIHPAYINNPNAKLSCVAKFPVNDPKWELTYIIWTNIAQFIIPVSVLLFCYGSIYLLVSKNFSMRRLIHTKNNSFNASTNHLSINNKSSTIFNHLIGTHIHVNYHSAASRCFRQQPPHVLNSRCPTVDCIPNSANGDSFDRTVTYHKNQHRKNVYIRDAMYPVVIRLSRQSNISVESADAYPRQHCANFLSRARLKTIKLTFIVVILYIICSTPFYVGSIIMTLNNKFISKKTANWLYTIFSLMLNLNSCSNPVIYLTLSGGLFSMYVAFIKLCL